jgi:hypothetical protein
MTRGATGLRLYNAELSPFEDNSNGLPAVRAWFIGFFSGVEKSGKLKIDWWYMGVY